MLVRQLPAMFVKSNCANLARGGILLPTTVEKLHKLICGIFREIDLCGELERMGERCGNRVL